MKKKFKTVRHEIKHLRGENTLLANMLKEFLDKSKALQIENDLLKTICPLIRYAGKDEK